MSGASASAPRAVGDAAPSVRPYMATDREAVLALNREEEAQTFPMTGPELDALVSGSFRTLVAPGNTGVRGFVVALDEGAPYASPNFLWFRERETRFVYVDRVATAGTARGQGVGRALYEAVFAAAREAGHGLVTCEVNLEPPNPISDAFHAALGFREVGRAPAKGRFVRYLVREL